MRIEIRTISHSRQRYPTVGDWVFDGDTLRIAVSDTGNPHHAFLVGLHEMIEAYLCRVRGVPEESVTAFDLAFEVSRAPGNTDEPGDDPLAPYRREHFFATSIERLMAAELGVDWTVYDAAVNDL